MDAILKDRRVLAAIGFATVLVAIKWLFFGSLLSAADTIDSGKTGSTTTAALPFIFDAAVWILIAIGSRMVMFGQFVYGKLTQQAPQLQPVTSSAASPTQPDSKSLERLVIDLGDAVATNNVDRVVELQRQLRLPFALKEMQEAYTSGDVQAGKQFAAEVETLLASDEASTDKKRGAK